MAEVATASNVADWSAGPPPCFASLTLRFDFGLYSPDPRDVGGEEDDEEEAEDDDDGTGGDRLFPAPWRPLCPLSRMRATSRFLPGELDRPRLAGSCGSDEGQVVGF